MRNIAHSSTNINMWIFPRAQSLFCTCMLYLIKPVQKEYLFRPNDQQWHDKEAIVLFKSAKTASWNFCYLWLKVQNEYKHVHHQICGTYNKLRWSLNYETIWIELYTLKCILENDTYKKPSCLALCNKTFGSWINYFTRYLKKNSSRSHRNS